MPPYVEVAIRSVCIIIGLFFVTKFLGKKQLSKLSFFEYIAGITIGDIAGTLSMDAELNLANGITSILIWSLFPIIVSYFSIKNRFFRDFVEGKPTTLIKDGKLLEKNLRKEQYTAEGLLEQLRKKDIFRVADVEFAALETNGEISVLLKSEKQPILYGDIFPEKRKTGVTQTLIEDGEIFDDGLACAGLNRKWLQGELGKRNLTVENVFLAQVDPNGDLFIDTYDDELNVPQNKDKELLISAFQKLSADLNFLSVSSKDSETRRLYGNLAQKISGTLKMVNDLKRAQNH
ncbi:DUF421 domain-containing protein [Peribacillus alkalitolerans]|uniref:DUF421 domain-containing protein n=1 Tax=Peribacillus alkalitolerans TaxID=1550385 RepID=UPI0013D137B9|nr:DUF421 domain-containing protein [Peribacillus alkalitolerans]